MPAKASAAECTDTWIGPAEGSWAIAANWSAAHVPSEADVACIQAGKAVKVEPSETVGVVQGEGALTISGTLNLTRAPNEAVSSIATLTLGGGTLGGVGSIEVTASLSASLAALSGTGSTILGSAASATISKTRLIERHLVNHGNLAVSSGYLLMSTNATLENTGTLTVNAEGLETGITLLRSDTTPSITNSGTIRKTAGSGQSAILPNVTNTGVVKAETGTLAFNGNWSLGSGTSLIGNLSFVSTQTITAAHSFTAKSGTLALTGSVNLVIEAGNTAEVENLTLGGSKVQGSGTLKVLGLFSDTNGELEGSGSTVLLPTAIGSVNRTWMKNGYTLVNEGTTTFASDSFLMGSGTVLRNQGTFNANAEGTGKGIIIQPGSSPEPRVVNKGRFQKTAGTGTTEIGPAFENAGAIVESSGKLKILKEISVASSTGTPHHSSCGDPVDCATGNFTETQTDLEIGGRGVGLDLTRTYSAQMAASGLLGIFGYGWTNSFGDKLTSEESGAKETLTEASGGTVAFVKSGASWIAPTWSQDVLAGSAESGFTLMLPDQTKEAFTGTGRLEAVTDRNGNETGLAYNGSGKLETITDPSGRKITLTYNAEGLVEKAKDPMGHEVKYAYEAKSLKSATLSGEASPTWQFKYDASHRMTSMTDGRGGKTTNEYDSSSRVIAQTDPAERKTTWEYAPFHTKITNKDTGAVTDEWFNSNNQPYSITRGFGAVAAATETLTYTAAGLLASRADGNGHTTIYGYDAEGNRTSERNAEGDETKWTYNEAHGVTSETKPNGEKSTFSLNANGDPETVSRPAPESKTQTLSYEYGPQGEVKAMTDPLGHIWSYEYDKYGDRTSETDPEGDEQTWGYNEDSQVTSKVSPRGNEEGAEAAKYTTLIERDARGRPIKVTDPLGASTKFAYDPDGNIESITDPNGHKTKFTYDADNERTKVERPNGAIEETGYDGAGQITGQIDGDKQKTTYVRNVLEQPVEIIDPLERKTTQTFDAAGNPKSRTDPEGRTTTYGYDKANRLKEISYSGEPGQGATFAYNEDGDLTSVVDATGESTWEYDQLGRLTHSKDGHGETVGWTYNLADEPVGLTYPNGKSISRAYDKAGRLEGVTDWLGHTTSFAYNPDSEPTATTFPVATTDVDEYAWDRADRMSSVTMEKGGETLASLAYSRDPAGQLESLMNKGLPGAKEEAFSYDETERLTKAGSAEFGYDAANNITKAPGTTNAFDKASEIESATGAAFTFDKEGARTKETPSSGPATTYKYDQAGDLAAIERAEEGETPAIAESFGYDGTGLLTSRTVGLTTAHFVWDLSGSPELLLSDGEDSYVYGPGGLAVEAISAGEVPTYLHHDQLGSTRLLTNASGEATGAFTYGAYGALTGHSGTATTALGYAGQYTLGQSGLQYLRARFYDPATAQFMTRDPIESFTRSPYGYAKENPVGRIDPSGLCGVSSVGDFFESFNPISEENCAYEAASSATEAVSNISLPSTREAAEAEVGFFDGGTAGLTKYARELLGIGNGGLALCGSTYEDSGIAGAAVFSVLAPETPEGALTIASRFPDASMWVARHGDEVNQVKDVVEEVIRHVVGK